MNTEKDKQVLPRQWVDRIFKKLTLMYGMDFLQRWEGIDEEEVKADWAEELGRFADAPHAIAYALQYAPLKPPTVREFAEITNRAPPPNLIRLPPPERKPPSAEQRARLHKTVADMLRAMGNHKAAEQSLKKAEAAAREWEREQQRSKEAAPQPQQEQAA